MSISLKTRQAYSEIDEFLMLLDEEQRQEIPQRLRELFREEKDKDYHKGIKANIPIKEQNLKEETLAIIALLNLQYWCKDEEEKKRLQEMYSKNEKEYQEFIHEKYNPDNIFKSKNEDVVPQNQLVEYKKSLLKKFVDKILAFFRRK